MKYLPWNRKVEVKPYFFLLLLIFITGSGHGQNLQSNNLLIEEYLRRQQLMSPESQRTYSFNLRPSETDLIFKKIDKRSTGFYFKKAQDTVKQVRLQMLPIMQRANFNTKRVYGWADGPMIPNVGSQYYISTGFYAKLWIFHLQIQPEYVLASNNSYKGLDSTYSESIILSKFRDYNTGDYPERFGEGNYSRLGWGQSKLTMNAGSFELGISTQNIWWGPGQWNGLIFSYNAAGFPYLTLNTSRPAKTFLGNFEGQILAGRLENSMLEPTQVSSLNEKFFREFSGDWRYLNAIVISYNPKWISGLFLGGSRSFQQYNANRGDLFRDYFPIFDVLQKEKIFKNDNSVEFDNQGRDQQLTIFFRLLVPPAKAEIYGEFGKRDHNYNWREATLNPEHARAYLFGFKKLVSTSAPNQFIQVRSEVTHQQESVNRYIRYPGTTGGLSWHTHTRARGFSQWGQPLGVGIGIGSNIQTLEVALVDGLKKKGILVERLANSQDFYYRALAKDPTKNPWIDLSFGLLWDHQWGDFILTSKTQFIKSYNYQWQNGEDSTPDFPTGNNPLAFYGSFSLIYQIPR